jgi:hypothetical protein
VAIGRASVRSGPSVSRQAPLAHIRHASIARRVIPSHHFGIAEIAKSTALSAHPVSSRGTLRPIVTKREAGCDGCVGAPRRSAHDADGEAVWSWPPDAEVKLREAGFARRRWLPSPAHRGDHGVSRKPSRRECRNVRRACGFELVCFLHCTRGRGCTRHPAFPAPSVLLRATNLQSSGKSCRGNAVSHLFRCRAPP